MEMPYDSMDVDACDGYNMDGCHGCHFERAGRSISRIHLDNCICMEQIVENGLWVWLHIVDPMDDDGSSFDQSGGSIGSLMT